MGLTDLTVAKFDYDFAAKEQINTINLIKAQIATDVARSDELKAIIGPVVSDWTLHKQEGLELAEVTIRIDQNLLSLSLRKTDMQTNLMPLLSTQEYKDELQAFIDTI